MRRPDLLARSLSDARSLGVRQRRNRLVLRALAWLALVLAVTAYVVWVPLP